MKKDRRSPRVRTLVAPARIWRGPFVTFAVLLVALAAGADSSRTPLSPLEDRVELVALPHEVLAVDGARGGERRASLGVGEQIVSSWADGEVGLFVTDRRLLAVAIGSGGFREARLFLDERIAGEPMLGDRVALVITSRRALGFDGGSGSWVEARLGPQERVVASAVANHVAALATDRRALGLSPVRGGFFEAPLALRDGVLTLEAKGDLASLRTRTRLLTFRAASGQWTQRDLGLLH